MAVSIEIYTFLSCYAIRNRRIWKIAASQEAPHPEKHAAQILHYAKYARRLCLDGHCAIAAIDAQDRARDEARRLIRGQKDRRADQL